jgi:hypothetical protein
MHDMLRDAPQAKVSRRAPIDVRWPTLRRQIGECAMLPAIATGLPWALAWRAMRVLAARDRLFGRETREAQAICETHGFVADARAWTQRYRLTRMVDHVDAAISATRGDRWMDRHVDVAGDPLPPAPCLFIGFHYGTAFWTLRHLRRLGHRVSFLSAPIDEQAGRAEPLRLAYTRWRQKQVARAGGAPVIYVGGSGGRIRTALRDGGSVVALIDVPEPTTPAVPVSVLGHTMLLPDGVVRIGASERVPLIAFVGTLDPRTGRRRLRFTRLPSQPDDTLHALAGLLEAAIRDDPPAWHFWNQWPRLAPAAIVRSPQRAGPSGELR